MSEFRKVSIITGAVTETKLLADTVKIINELCSADDVEEIIIAYPPKEVSDKSLSVINALENFKGGIPVRLIEEKRPFMRSIIDVFAMAKGSHIIVCPSDMAFDLTCIPEMIKYAKAEPETIVTASRLVEGGGFYDYGKAKEIFNRMSQFYLRVLFGTRLTDMTIPYQIVPARVYKDMNIEGQGFQIFLQLVLKPLRLGYKFREIPTKCYARQEGKSRNSIKETAKYLTTSLHIRFTKKEDLIYHGGKSTL